MGIAAAVGFTWLEATQLPTLVPALFGPPLIAGVPKAFGITLLVLVLSAFWLTLHGFSVGAARKKYAELAKKDGEKDVDKRYNLRACFPLCGGHWPLATRPHRKFTCS